MSNSQSNGETNSIKTAMNDSTVEWLRKTYPSAMSDAERMRMAVSDAQRFQQLVDQTELGER